MAKLSILPCALIFLALIPVGCAEPVSAGTVAGDNAVVVQFVSARIGKVPLQAGKKTVSSEQDVLQIRINVENRSGSTKLQYRGWGGDSTAYGLKATLKDDLGNEYKPATFGLLQKPVSQKSNESIYPGTSTEDVLLFEVPVEKAQKLHLFLPRGNYLQSVSGPTELELAIPMASLDGAA